MFVIGIQMGKNSKNTKIAARLTPQKRKMINKWGLQVYGELYLSTKTVMQEMKSWDIWECGTWQKRIGRAN